MSILAGILAQSAWSYERRTPVVEAVEKVLPAVVNISTSKDVRVRQNPFPFSSQLFDFPFRDRFERTYRFEALGSGVVVEGGYVITNNHVIDYDFGAADKIFVTTYGDNESHEAIIVGTDPREDLAILKVEGDPLPHHLSWGRSDDLMIGETVIAVGNALGQPFTVTNGIISALNRTIEEDEGHHLSNLIQTNADINRGNSGGPLVNINGEFIGLNTAIISPSGGSVGLGFAIPVARVRSIYNYWVKRMLSLKDYLGVQVQDITPPIDYFFRNEFPSLKNESIKGVVITEVLHKGAAAESLKRMDLIESIDGKDVKNSDDFNTHLEEHLGNEISLELIREGKRQQVDIPISQQKVKTISWQGMVIQEIDNHWRSRYDLGEEDEGLVVSAVQKIGAAKESEIRAGDIIKAIYLNRKGYSPRTLSDLQELNRAVPRPTEIVVDVYRQRKTYQRGELPWDEKRIVLHPAKSL